MNEITIATPKCPHGCGKPAQFLQTPTYESQAWEFSCQECTPEPAYYVPLREINNPAQALNWLHHLSEKPWISRDGIETIIARIVRLYPETGIG